MNLKNYLAASFLIMVFSFNCYSADLKASAEFKEQSEAEKFDEYKKEYSKLTNIQEKQEFLNKVDEFRSTLNSPDQILFVTAIMAWVSNEREQLNKIQKIEREDLLHY